MKILRLFVAVIMACCIATAPLYAKSFPIGTRLFTPTISDPIISNPTITGTTSIGAGATITSPTISTGITGTAIVSATNIADVVRYFQIPLSSFTLEYSTAIAEAITTSTAPGWEMDDNMPGIVWADNEVSAIVTTFIIPTDYVSGGAFKIMATESGTSTPNQIDFEVWVNSDGVVVDTSATNQTPVALAGTSSTPDVVTLTPATDFASLAAGNWVTLKIWRDNVATGTNDLEVKGVAFYYTASQ